jgi:hypothetical protein
MDYYDISCELDKISGKIECFSKMIGALAESDTDNRYSGTYWFIFDTAKQYIGEIEALSSKVMANHMAIRDEQFKEETRKGKKNADGKKK